MIVRRKGRFDFGYTPITEMDGRNSDMLMDFGILRVRPGETVSNGEGKERALLLMSGRVRLSWRGRTEDASRNSLLGEGPAVLHLPAGVDVAVTAPDGPAELALQKVRNGEPFEPKLYRPGDYRSEQFGSGPLAPAAARTVRTVFDAETAPDSNMVLGEVVGYPGKWSSYPPHRHPQPEVYHYRFFPGNGFGYSEQGEEVFKVRDGDTALIPPEVTHPQTAAPGYAMYYIWMIPHLENARFGPDSRDFVAEHRWLLAPDADIWDPSATSPAPTA